MSSTKELIRSGAFCAVPAVGGAGEGGALHELGPLALMVVGFAGVGVWMFRRYGAGSKRSQPVADTQSARAPSHGAPAGSPVGA